MRSRGSFLLFLVTSLLGCACERDPGWRVGTSGAGPIGLDDPLDAASLRQRFPGMRVSQVDPGENDAGGGAFRITRDAERVMDVWVHSDGRVSQIHVNSPRIPSVSGPRVGDAIQALAGLGPGLVCLTQSGSPHVICSLKDLPRVFFIFEGAGIDAPDVRPVTLAEMADRRVTQIWFFGRIRK